MDGRGDGHRHDVEIELIDVDHRLQTRLIDSLEIAVKQGRQSDVGRGLLVDLVEYTRAHFQSERLLMRSHAYPRLAEHVKEHDTLLRQLLDLKKAHTAEGRPITAETVATIRSLFVAHAQGLDSELAEALVRMTGAVGPPASTGE